MLDPSDLVLTAVAPAEAPGAPPVDDVAPPATFGRVVGDHWCFAERAFGGYTAALSVAAALAATGRGHVASAAIMFLEPGRPGPARFTVHPLRTGRSAEAVRVVARQGERTVLEASLWLADAWRADPGSRPAVPPPPDPAHADDPGPDDAADLAWLLDVWTMLHFAERRAIDYPTGFTSFARGVPRAALWVRADLDPAADDPPHPQVVDVLHLDAHLFDAPGMVTGFTSPDDPTTGTSMISLDLAVAWQPGASARPATDWRRLDTHGSVGEGGVTSWGSLTDVDGRRLATATSQGLARR